jgi:hypothetical protein
MARTAVIASTATATSRAVSGAMEGSAPAQQQQVANAAAMQSQAEIDQLKAQMDVMQMQQTLAATPAPPAVAAAPAASPDILSQLQQLTQLKDAGALSDAEFQLAKAKLLAG